MTTTMSGRAWRCEYCGEDFRGLAATCPDCLELERAVCDAAGLYLRCQTSARPNALADANAAYARAARRPCQTCCEALEVVEDREAGAHAGACLSAERLGDAIDRKGHRRRDEGWP